jgi:hypothetical protein
MVTFLKRANSRRVSLAAAALVILSFAPVLAQTPAPAPPSDVKSASKNNALTLRGCLEGSLLTKIEPREFATVAPPEVRLSASRAMRKLLKEHNGAYVEVTGTLKGYDNVATGGLTVKDTGKTRVYVGASERRQPDEITNPMPTLDVGGLTVIAPMCQGH